MQIAQEFCESYCFILESEQGDFEYLLNLDWRKSKPTTFPLPSNATSQQQQKQTYGSLPITDAHYDSKAEDPDHFQCRRGISVR
jgi:hypothetical protein